MKEDDTTGTDEMGSHAEDDLKSERFGDNYYGKLRDLLKTQNWLEADQETNKRMCEVMDRQAEGWLGDEDIFPCQDLGVIDQLWVKYSQGKFGFSVQKRIYVECGARLDGKNPGAEIWVKYARLIGCYQHGEWLSYQDLVDFRSFSEGTFPYLVWCGVGERFFSRLHDCGL